MKTYSLIRTGSCIFCAVVLIIAISVKAYELYAGGSYLEKLDPISGVNIGIINILSIAIDALTLMLLWNKARVSGIGLCWVAGVFTAYHVGSILSFGAIGTCPCLGGLSWFSNSMGRRLLL